MEDDGATKPGSRTVVVVGALPPPIHGMALVTASIVQRLRGKCTLHVVDISPGSLRRGLLYHFSKSRKVIGAKLALIARCLSGPRTLYMPADARWGVLYTTFLALTARLLRYRIVIHHHAYAYVVRFDARMNLLVGVAGRNALHVLLCEDMRRRFCENYPRAAKTLVLGNTVFLPAAEDRPARPPGPLRLGHLSNLSAEKGLDHVLALYRKLRQAGGDYSLVLAGPAVSLADQSKIAAAKEEFGPSLEHRGPVDGASKKRFYEDIDIFLFPTCYFNEAQPLVLLEAMSRSIPVISYARGCIDEMLGQGDPGSIPLDEAFETRAAALLTKWREDPRAMAAASGSARARFGTIATIAAEALGELMEFLVYAGRDVR